MGHFYITKTPYQQHRRTKEDSQHDEWFYNKEESTKGLTFDELPATKIVMRRWCQNNLEGDVSVELGLDHDRPYGSQQTYTFWFELETDAIAFKLRWA